jgi:hypothetical protein
LFYIELLLYVLFLISALQFSLLQFKVLLKVDIGLGGKGGDFLLSDGIVLGVDADIIEGFLTAEEGLVDDSSGAILAPSHSVLSQHYFTGIVVD